MDAFDADIFDERRTSNDSTLLSDIEDDSPDSGVEISKNPPSFEQRCLIDSKFEVYVHMSMEPEAFTMDYYHEHGMSEVLFFNCEPRKLGMKVPDSSFTPRQVMELVGENRSVKMLDVTTQYESARSMKEFVEYYENPQERKKKVLNVISLEVGGTGMADMIQAPSLIRQIDLSSAWPDERKQRACHFTKRGAEIVFTYDNIHPSADQYCLMSPKGAYTGFHIDNHGAAFWYHVVSGSKTYFLIEPTDENLKKYEEYEKNMDRRFFGDCVEECARVTITAGQTIIVPSGWIHAVYTGEDSLVIGGNFFHARSLEMQQKIMRLEEKLELTDETYFPYDKVLLHYMDHVVQKVTRRLHIRPTPRNRQIERLQYVGSKFIQEKRHLHIPSKKDFSIDGQGWKKISESKEYKETCKIFARFAGMEDEEVDSDEFFMEDHPLIFFHPKEFDVESSMNPNANPFKAPLPPRFGKNDAKMNIDEVALRQCIHPAEIYEWEQAIVYLLSRDTKGPLPDGLTRPNSLLESFYSLLEALRRMESRKRANDPTKFDVPTRSVLAHVQQWYTHIRDPNALSAAHSPVKKDKKVREKTVVKKEFVVVKKEVTADQVKKETKTVEKKAVEEKKAVVKKQVAENQSRTDKKTAEIVQEKKVVVKKEVVEDHVKKDKMKTAEKKSVEEKKVAEDQVKKERKVRETTVVAKKEVLVVKKEVVEDEKPVKRVRVASKRYAAEMYAPEVEDEEEEESEDDDEYEEVMPPPRKRAKIEPKTDEEEEEPKRGRGRPKKETSVSAPVTPVAARTAVKSEAPLAGVQFSTAEDDAIIDECRRWLLNEPVRAAERERELNSRVFKNKKEEWNARRNQSNPLKKPHLWHSVQNINNILARMPGREHCQVDHRLTKLQKRPEMKQMLARFRAGKLKR